MESVILKSDQLKDLSGVRLVNWRKSTVLWQRSFGGGSHAPSASSTTWKLFRVCFRSRRNSLNW
ncbi:hypothetical protein AXF42_Ash011952 [Apostasia shenzhenica]|uniref:Uncharacterized protein n=1 Tax=Apostasia shenzhenica TaxID=1088818 RepID=A0A2I0AWA2_9ASPA|nr:hypothetical protein AXF42_Ash011952 [Apostasia shenzhenica]